MIEKLIDSKEFQGSDFVYSLDASRLRGQCRKIYELMIDGKWRALREIEEATGAPQASASAQLRDFRKKKFKMILEKRRRGNPKSGLFEYQLLPPEPIVELNNLFSVEKCDGCKRAENATSEYVYTCNCNVENN